MPRGERPHWELMALNPHTEKRSRVGVGWDQDDGSIQIKLDPFVVLRGELELKIRLFRQRAEGFLSPQGGPPPAAPRKPDLDDEIPF